MTTEHSRLLFESRGARVSSSNLRRRWPMQTSGKIPSLRAEESPALTWIGRLNAEKNCFSLERHILLVE